MAWRGRCPLAVIVLVALLGAACTRGLSSGTVNAQPPDLYAAQPSLADVRALLGDNSWIPGPPSFAVRPLDDASMPLNQKFSVTQPYLHLGTSESFAVDYTLWSTTSAASNHMTNIQTALGAAITSPKVGDQVLYYGSHGSGAAPYGTVTFVRLGQIVTTIALSLKDAFPKVAQLGKIAAKVESGVKDLVSGKSHSSPSPVDSTVLPPAGLDITLLGTATISVEAAMAMIDAPSIDAIAQTLRSRGLSDVAFGDYALNSDTHMEVRASVFKFVTAKDATDWLTDLRSTFPLDANGIASFYDTAHGRYMFVFVAGTSTALLICRSTAGTEAASRSCEAPLSSVASAWKLSLGTA